MTSGRGRPRRAPYVLCTHHGAPAIRIYLPGGGDVRRLVPLGWSAAAAFTDWLREYAHTHDHAPLPDAWRLYSTDEAPPHRETLPARTVLEPSAAPSTAWTWHDACDRFERALRDGWTTPGAARAPYRPESIPGVIATCRRWGHAGAARTAPLEWGTVAALTGPRVHARIQELEALAKKHTSIHRWRACLRSFAWWLGQQGQPVEQPTRWPVYSRRYEPRAARATTGDVDLAIESLPWTSRKGSPVRPVIILMRWTGLRRMGLARLPRSAFFLDDDAPHLAIDAPHDKARGVRYVPLPPPAVKACRQWFDEHNYQPHDLPFGRRRPDGTVKPTCELETWRRLLDRAGVPRNFDGTAGLHRIRKAGFSAMLDRPAMIGGGPADSWRAALGLTGVSPATLDSYYRRSTPTELHAAALAPPSAHGRPVQLTLNFDRGGAVAGEVRHEDGTTSAAPLPQGGEQHRRVLALVAEITAIAADGLAQKSGTATVTRVDMVAWRKSASRALVRRPRSTAAGRGRR
jgi:integrase